MADATRKMLPAHIEGTIEAIARLQAEHNERATPFQKLTENLTARAGRPSFLAWLLTAVATWIATNLLLTAFSARPLDDPPFGWLELATGLAALLMTVLILSTQRRDDLSDSQTTQESPLFQTATSMSDGAKALRPVGKAAQTRRP